MQIRSIAATLAVCLSGVLTASAAELDVKNGSTDLTTAASYTQNTAPNSSSDITFNGTLSPRAFTVNTNLGVGTLNDISNNGGGLTISDGAAGTATLTLNNAGPNVVAPANGGAAGDLIYISTGTTVRTFTITGPGTGTLGLALAASGNFDVATAGTGVDTLAISAAITGANSITKTGGGVLTQSGANTYSGGTTLSAGTLNVNSGTVLTGGGPGTPSGGIGTGALTINGGTLDSNVSGGANLSTQTVASGANAGTYTGTNNAVNINGDFTYGGTNDLNLGNGTTTIAGTTRTITTNGTSSSGLLTIGGSISAPTLTLIKAGTGNLALGGTNSFSAVTVQAGLISDVSSGGAGLGGSGTAVDLGGGGSANVTFKLGGFSASSTEAENITTTGTGLPLLIRQADSNNSVSFSGTVTLNDTANPLNIVETRPSAASKNITFSNVISGAGGITLANGAAQNTTNQAVIVLTAANTYTGTTTINGTTNTGTTGKSTSTLQLGNGGTTGSLSITGGASGTGSAIVDNSVFAINRSNAVAQGTDFSPAAVTGTGAFLQAGSGTTTLNVANSYSGGTTVSAGQITAAANGALGSGAVTINAGNLTINSGVTDAINNAANLTLSSSATLTLLGTGATPPDSSHPGVQEIVNGLIINGAGQTAGIYGPQGDTNAQFQIAQLTAGSAELEVLNTVTVPEPRTWVLVGAGLAFLGLRACRFRRAVV